MRLHPTLSAGDFVGARRKCRTHLLHAARRAVRLQEAAGVDLVLSGHSHSYERTWPLNGHYGVSSTLKPCNIVSREARDSFTKPLGINPNRGTVCVPGAS
jgi:hypothetical protein